jgi:hypothetical protein
MAKQHRMAAITAAAAISMLEPLWGGHNQVLTVAMWIVAVGAALTAIRRGRTLVLHLKGTG